MLRWLSFVLVCACNTAPVRAYRATADNLAALGLTGDAVDARPGDIIMRSSKAVAVIQRPLRDIGPVPHGGNLIDLALLAGGVDRFGETQPLHNLGRTIAFERIDILRDGSDGEAVEVEAQGGDVVWDFANIAAIDPKLLFYSPDGSGLLLWDSNAPVPVRVRARYTLEPDGDVVTIRYLYENVGNSPLELSAAYGMDTGGAVDFFIPGVGFGTPLSSFDFDTIVNRIRHSGFAALVGDDVSYIVRSLSSSGRRPIASVAFSAAGVGLFVPGEGGLLDVLSSPNMRLPPHATREVVFEVQVARTLAEGWSRLLERDGVPTTELSGIVHGGARRSEGSDVIILGEDGRPWTSTRLSPDDTFSFSLPAGRYRVLADLDEREPLISPELTIGPDLVPMTIQLGAPAPATIAIEARFYDGAAALAERPCRVSVLGDVPPVRERGRLRRETSSETLLDRALRHCSSATDGSFMLPPGRHIVQVSAGPLMTMARIELEVESGQSYSLAPVLERIALGSQMSACDFHQHSRNSPDSIIPFELRVLGYAAEGIDFFASSDHDKLTDYAPVIAALGLEGTLESAVGVETTTFPYGHFNAWPLPIDPELPSGGAIDWGRESYSLLPRDIFATFRARGAAIVQVNHPRDTSGAKYQSFFDRAALSVDPDAGLLGADPLLQPISNELLRLPPGEPLWSEDFDVIEILNGFSTARAELILRDWLGFLALGLRPSVVGVSDSHKSFSDLPGYPRTYVASEANAEAVAAALRAGRAVASNGPMLSVEVETSAGRGGLGAVVTAPGGEATLHVRVDANIPALIDRLDVYVNTWVKTPTDAPLVPTLSVPLELVPQALTQGGTSYSGSARAPLTAPADAFVVVRAIGSTPLRALLPGNDEPAHAIANPIYLDVDGDGLFTPPRSRR